MAAFALKAGIFRVRRGVVDAWRRPRRWPLRRDAAGTLLAEISAPLRPRDPESDPGEALLVAGKIENLRIALRRLDGATMPAHGTFSFWRQIGRAGARAGYVEGRELREGCIVPSIGGGLCLLSNALYGAALDSGCEIVERHAHSTIVPGSLTERDRDATVFWNYVDLRFRARHELTIRAVLEADRLVVRFYGAMTPASSNVPANTVAPILEGAASHSCASCNVSECSRHREPVARTAARTAFLVDAYSPEHDAFVRERATARDVLCLPLDGKRFRRPQYAWTIAPFGYVRQFPIATLRRSLRSRALAAQGAERQRALLAESERLARLYARTLAPDIEHLVVAQTLLPFLWRDGHLGGRTFDVLATALPMRVFQRALDDAARNNPQSATLGDFRADPELVNLETAALARARAVVTPHAVIARIFGDRAELLAWASPRTIAPPLDRSRATQAVFFAGSTLGRTGSYEMREAARRLGLPLIVTRDEQLEALDFWAGIDVRVVDDLRTALERARVAVLPAYVEHRPRRLLQALAAGVPVVASTACGLQASPLVTLVPAGDLEALCGALAERSAVQPREDVSANVAGMP